ncbi:aspartyl protease family protein [Flavobacterium sp.]|uniref:aspartyl protease family protein n=1 Tax=Flavobacterium sp. TaxID=239 RepID=UPI002627EA91|nr:aspartyl protease family protein [Flavobacterium sp.]
MFCRLYSVLLLFGSLLAWGQSGFELDNDRKKSKIPFQWVNNLIILPVELNGIPLNFLLDTGVEETILFSLDDPNEVQFSTLEKVKIKGFGANEPIDAYRADHNSLRIGSALDNDHKVYILLDQEINISSSVGLPVNGIVGAHFFKNFLVRIDYVNQRLIIGKSLQKVKRRKEQFTPLPLYLVQNKPYVKMKGQQGIKTIDLLQLLDTGNTDAAWLFPAVMPQSFLSKNTIQDYLGKGLSGTIYGNRSRIDGLKWDTFMLPRPIVAMPDSLSMTHLVQVTNRTGSIGNEFLRRFHVIFDYAQQQLYIRPNRDYDDPFRYNMSGIEVKHQGLQWIAKSQRTDSRLTYGDITFEGSSTSIRDKIKYQFELKPIYVVANVRPDSPGAKVGIQKGDILLTIEEKEGHEMSLDQINSYFKQQDGKSIEMELEHLGNPYKVTLVLKDVLP